MTGLFGQASLSDLGALLVDVVLIKGSLLVALGALTARALRSRSAAVQHGVWTAVFFGLAVTAVAEIVTQSRSPEGAETAKSHSAAVVLPALPEVSEAPASVAASPPILVQPTPWLRYAVGLWALGLMCNLLHLLGVHLRGRRLVRASTSAPRRVERRMLEVAGALRLATPPSVRISAELWSPGVAGTFQTTILLPSEAASWNESELNAALAHEASHIRRRDPFVVLMSRLVSAVFWPNPLVAYAVRKMEAARERACDDAAVNGGSSPVAYAEQLLRLALAGSGRRASVLSMATSPLGERIDDVLSADRPRGPLRRSSFLAFVAVSVVAASSLGAVRVLGVQMAPSLGERLDGLASADAETRRHAAWSLGELEDPAAVPRLVRALDDQDPDVRVLAAWALGEVKDPAAISPLSAALSDTNPRVREMAVVALGEIEDRSALEAVRRAGADASLRAVAEWARAEIERPGTHELWAGELRAGERVFDGSPTVAALESNDPAVRAQTALALGRAGNADAVGALIAALSDPEATVRAAATWALDEINPSRLR